MNTSFLFSLLLSAIFVACHGNPVNLFQVPKKDVVPDKCRSDCIVHEGQIDYKVFGNSMNLSENRHNCGQKASSYADVSLPAGATVVKAYLNWSGSGKLDDTVTLNGSSVVAEKTSTDYIPRWRADFFVAWADVTEEVKKTRSGRYTVQDLSWDITTGHYCYSHHGYGVWSLVVVYENRGIKENSRIHVCQDKFYMTFPHNRIQIQNSNYYSTIECVQPAQTCKANAKLTLATYNSKSDTGEKLIMGNQMLARDEFRGQTAPNLDILSFDLDDKHVGKDTKSVSYYFSMFVTDTKHDVFDVGKTEALFDNLKVLKYRSDCEENEDAELDDNEGAELDDNEDAELDKNEGAELDKNGAELEKNEGAELEENEDAELEGTPFWTGCYLVNSHLGVEKVLSPDKTVLYEVYDPDQHVSIRCDVFGPVKEVIFELGGSFENAEHYSPFWIDGVTDYHVNSIANIINEECDEETEIAVSVLSKSGEKAKQTFKIKTNCNFVKKKD